MSSVAWMEANKDKIKEYKRNWYQRHKAGVAPKKKTRRRMHREWILEIKSKLRCERCPENHPACLHFHHKDPTTKSFTIGNAVGARTSKEKILAEIAKCIVLCANCHAKEHYEIYTVV